MLFSIYCSCFLPTYNTIEQAHQQIAPFTKRTPVLTSATLNHLAGTELFFKCENLQKGGAFKIRGATYAALSLTTAEIKNGLATHSSGNHGQAVAITAKQLGVKAYIVMPKNALSVKQEAVLRCGGEVILCEPTLEAREETLKDVLKKTGAAFIHPYNDYRVITGQATVAKELLEEIAALDIIIVPVGGGGLISGTAFATKYFSPQTLTIGAEPAGADDAFRSLSQGELQKNKNPKSICDGLLASLGEKTFAIIRRHVSRIITVTDEEVLAGMQLIHKHLKMVVEPSAAITLAAALKEKKWLSGKRVGIILSGGNV